MPSPVAHLAAGYVLYRYVRGRVPAVSAGLLSYLPLAVMLCVTMLPDLDSVVGVAAHDLPRFHNNLTHSFAAGIVIALAAAGLARFIPDSGGAVWGLITLAFYSLHVVMDYFTAGRGVMIFWPFIADRFMSPVCIFRGVRWSSGLWSAEHLLTLVNELCFVGALALVARMVRMGGRKQKEILR